MKLLFTGDINFRGIENLDYDKSLEILNDITILNSKFDNKKRRKWRCYHVFYSYFAV